MSKDFSLFSWLTRLPSSKSVIISHRGNIYKREGAAYYALAEDWRGEHCPYPMLPKWAKRLFQARLALAERLHQKVPVRGWDWYFRCPECQAKSFYTYRNQRCWACGTYFNAELEPTNRMYSRRFGQLKTYMGEGKWEYRPTKSTYEAAKSTYEADVDGEFFPC